MLLFRCKKKGGGGGEGDGIVEQIGRGYNWAVFSLRKKGDRVHAKLAERRRRGKRVKERKRRERGKSSLLFFAQK